MEFIQKKKKDERRFYESVKNITILKKIHKRW